MPFRPLLIADFIHLSRWVTAAGALVAGLFLAQHHPLYPALTMAAFCGWTMISFCRPRAWLFVFPAVLPLLNFAPWTGWLIFGEFDLAVLGVAAGAYWRASRARPSAALIASLVAIGLLCSSGLYRGLVDMGPASFDWYQGYEDPLNSLRVAKSVIALLLVAPLLAEQTTSDRRRVFRHLALGMLAGLVAVVLAVLSERWAYPGLTNFKANYRTTAWFWEMHVGGAAIDGYLALATPFVAWALHVSRTPVRWTAAALLALLTGYACLTTFSRGVYFAIAVPLVLLGWHGWRERRAEATRTAPRGRLAFGAMTLLGTIALVASFLAFGVAGPGTLLAALAPLLWFRGAHSSAGWRARGSRTLRVVLALEILAVLGTGSFMTSRLAASNQDLNHRLAHWQDGLSLLHGPTEWLFGLGWGRIPSHYARFTPGHEFSGAVKWLDGGPGRSAVSLSGPKTQRILAGQYSLTQRVPIVRGAEYVASFDARSNRPINLIASVCEMHLLYERRCQSASVFTVVPTVAGLQRLSLPLRGPELSTGDWFAPRGGVFALTVAEQNASVEISQVSLQAAGRDELLRNGNFSAGLAHWFPVAQDYFVPWHIDNLYLEFLIETGIVGLAVFAAFMALALHSLWRSARRGMDFSPFLAASLCSALLVGALSSLLDVPRLAFLLMLLTLFSALQASEDPSDDSDH